MIPTAWQFTLLALAAYRLTRLAGWDDFPLAARARAWVTKETWTLTQEQKICAAFDVPPELLGLTSPEPEYGRPVLSHFLRCPFCVGFWISLATYGCWLAFPTETLYAAVPFALSGAVGLIAKNLDP